MSFYRIEGDRVLLNLKVTPGASKSEWAGEAGDRLRLRIAAAPEGGRANAALCAFAAKGIGCAKKDITLEAGETSRLKTISFPLAYLERFMLYYRKS